jgi:hypothetical protein
VELARGMSDRNDVLNALGIRETLAIKADSISLENDQDVSNRRT